MIRWIIGYVAMWWISTRVFVPVIEAIMIAISGHGRDDVLKIDDCRVNCANTRRSKYALNRLSNHNVVMDIVYLVFLIAIWPVEVLRMIFIDVPDAIEFYEAQQNKEGA